jgi:hypothetical protein
MKAILTICILFIFVIRSEAQISVAPAAFGFRFHYGFVYQHKKDMDQLVTGHIPAFELFYRRNFTGKREWEKFYRFPHSGTVIQYINFNNSFLGSGFCVMPYISFPIIPKRKYSELHFRLASGIGYTSKTFNLDDNRKNTVISSHFNAAFNLLLQYHWKISSGAELLTGISFTHFSNGKFKIPNAGINVVGANVGLSINVGGITGVNNNSFPVLNKRWKYIASFAGFVKETEPVNRKKFAAITLSANALKRFSPKSSYGTGIDFMYDASLKEEFRQQGKSLEVPVRIGLTADYELHVGKVTFPIQQGFYVIDAYKQDPIFYQRIGMRYHLPHNLTFQICLKTHFAKADFAEFGIGYFFR